MKDLDKMIEVRVKLLEIDTILYEVERDFRVSGHPTDNRLMRGMIESIGLSEARIEAKLSAINAEAQKNPVTGEAI